MNKNYLVLAAALGWLVFGCSQEKYQDLVPKTTPPDPTVQVRYTTQIASIMDNSCNSCHSAGSAPVAGGGHVYETYEQVSASAQSILNRINRSEGDALLMPQGGPKLSANQIATFQAWVNQGKLR
jgi:mono/diheme cytochrome c family protein